MRRSLVLLAGLALACSEAREPAPVSDLAVGRSEAPAQAAPPPAIPAEFEPLALDCEGAAIKAALAGLDPAALAAVDDGPSARLLARWERTRKFAADGSIERSVVDAFIVALETELGQRPPRWWIDQLASAKQIDRKDPPAYDLGLVDDGDRRGKLVAGPGATRVRPGVAAVLTGKNGMLYADLSMGRLELGPLPTDPDATIELGRAGSTIFYATFGAGLGGVRFPLRAVAHDGGQRWQAEVCGPDRKFLGGFGYLIVEIVVLEPPPDPDSKAGEMRASRATGIAVFTAESHGMAVEVFDPQTGARTLAWSSDLWFAR